MIYKRVPKHRMTIFIALCLAYAAVGLWVTNEFVVELIYGLVIAFIWLAIVIEITDKLGDGV